MKFWLGRGLLFLFLGSLFLPGQIWAAEDWEQVKTDWQELRRLNSEISEQLQQQEKELLEAARVRLRAHLKKVIDYLEVLVTGLAAEDLKGSFWEKEVLKGRDFFLEKEEELAEIETTGELVALATELRIYWYEEHSVWRGVAGEIWRLRMLRNLEEAEVFLAKVELSFREKEALGELSLEAREYFRLAKDDLARADILNRSLKFKLEEMAKRIDQDESSWQMVETQLREGQSLLWTSLSHLQKMLQVWAGPALGAKTTTREGIRLASPF